MEASADEARHREPPAARRRAQPEGIGGRVAHEAEAVRALVGSQHGGNARPLAPSRHQPMAPDEQLELDALGTAQSARTHMRAHPEQPLARAPLGEAIGRNPCHQLVVCVLGRVGSPHLERLLHAFAEERAHELEVANGGHVLGVIALQAHERGLAPPMPRQQEDVRGRGRAASERDLREREDLRRTVAPLMPHDVRAVHGGRRAGRTRVSASRGVQPPVAEWGTLRRMQPEPLDANLKGVRLNGLEHAPDAARAPS